MEKKKVAIGMSGGVDSSVAAYLLREKGYDVIGITMHLWADKKEQNSEPAGIQDAKTVAKALGIPHYVVDFEKVFKQNVIDYFVKEYEKGRTPNPCVVCNPSVKWAGLLSDKLPVQVDYVATGHYAKVVSLSNGRSAIHRARTQTKDQTYALYKLTQEQLKRTIMPLGDYEKEEIREIANRLKMVTADKKDSQDICFIPDGDYANFIENEAKVKAQVGNFVTKSGKILGTHKGIIHYTVGQRKGLGLAMGYPVFVLEIIPETNEVVVGTFEESLTRFVHANHVNFMMVADLEVPKRVWAKIRYNHKGAWCTIKKTGADEVLCTFEEEQRAVTPGQSVVFYDGDYILGGGTIIRR